PYHTPDRDATRLRRPAVAGGRGSFPPLPALRESGGRPRLPPSYIMKVSDEPRHSGLPRRPEPLTPRCQYTGRYSRTRAGRKSRNFRFSAFHRRGNDYNPGCVGLPTRPSPGVSFWLPFARARTWGSSAGWNQKLTSGDGRVG